MQVANPNNSTLVAVPTAYSLSAITTGGISVSFQASVVNAVLQGYSTADTANWDPTNPRFFSGTACTASATAVPLSGYLTHAQLCVGQNGSDTVVEEYYDKSLSPFTLPDDNSMNIGSGLSTTTIAAIFDSTHFADASNVIIKLKVWDSNSGYYEAQITAPVKNRLYGIANQSFGLFRDDVASTSLDSVKHNADAMNYFTATSRTDDKQAIYDTLPSYTVFYAFTHGFFGGGFGDCLATDNGGDAHFITIARSLYDNTLTFDYRSIQAIVATKTANLSLPPYNFIQLQACELGEDSSYADAFGITSGSPDRACLAWGYTIADNELERDWLNTLWSNLSAGKTLYDAAVQAGTDSRVFGYDERKESFLQLRSVPCTIFGDPKMTLHNVYQGTSGTDVSRHPWYRSL